MEAATNVGRCNFSFVVAATLDLRPKEWAWINADGARLRPRRGPRLAREMPEPGRVTQRRHGKTRRRRQDAVRTASGEWPWTRGNGQRRLDLNRAIAPGTVHSPCAHRQPLWPTARVPCQAMTARVTNSP